MRENICDVIFIFKSQWKESKVQILLKIIYGLCTSFQNLPSVIFPAMIIDEILGNRSHKVIVLYVVLFAFCMFIPRFILSFIGTLQSSYNLRLPHRFLLSLAHKMSVMDYEEVEREGFLDQYDNASNMAFQSCGNIFSLMALGFSMVLRLIALTAIISMLNPWVVVVLLVFSVLNCAMSAKEKRINIDYGKKETAFQRKADYAEGLLASLEFAKDCRAWRAADFANRKYMGEMQGVVEVQREKNGKLQRVNFLKKVLSFFQNGFLYAAMILEYIVGTITVGSFTMFINAANEFYSTIVTLLELYVQLKSTSLSFEQYRNVMELPETMRQTGYITEVNLQEPPSIEFKNVSFRYPGREEYALRNVNLLFRPSELAAIVGENGAGKTTFVKLVTRLYDPTEGEIRLNGRDIRGYDYDEYMKLFSPVFQDYKLFAYSIAENIAFDRYDASRYEDAVRKAGIWERIQRLPNRQETFLKKELENSGVELSGGEKQKIAIARAIYKNAPVAILDEPTASMDAIAEREIYDQFVQFSANKTTFFISHRMGSTRFCDHIIVLEQGEVAEEGSHEELMKLKGIYYNLYEKQASYYK